MGAPAKPLRVALGALIIKEKLQISDREVVEQIRENPYLQYFIGLDGYKDKEPFDPSLAGRSLRLLLAHATVNGAFQKTY